MKTIIEAISELLYVRDSVSVPGLGTFVTRRVSSKRNAITHQLEPTRKEISFDALITEDNDILLKHICSTQHITYEEAEARLSQFVADCVKDIEAGKSVILDGIGTLSNNVFMELEFVQDMSVNYNPDAFGLSTIELKPVGVFGDREQKLKQIVEQQDPRNDIPDGVDITMDDDEDSSVVDRRRRCRRAFLWLTGVILLLAILVIALVSAMHRGYLDILPKSLLSSLNKIELLFRTNNSSDISIDTCAERGAETRREVEVDSVGLHSNDNRHVAIINDTIIHDVDSVMSEEETILVGVVDTIEDTKIVDTLIVVEKPYFVIGGCFSQEQNAMVLVSELQSKGYQGACVAGQNKKGLWLVAYGSFETNDEAFKLLRSIRDTDGNAWILKK